LMLKTRKNKMKQYVEPKWKTDPLLCKNDETVGKIIGVKHPIFWRYFIYLICPKCKLFWRVYYEHTEVAEMNYDCTPQDKSSKLCVCTDDCQNPKRKGMNFCEDHKTQ